MDLQAFAAARRERLTRADDELKPFVTSALAGWSSSGAWYAELMDAASVLWLEIFEQEAPNADSERVLSLFQFDLRKALRETSQPTDTGMEAAINRLTYWLGTYTVNDATYRGNRARGGERMRWLTMKDEAVRASHRAADGQVAGVDGTFDIGGHNLRYPGEPVGPPEVWINCRCVLTPARVEGFDVGTITAAVPKPDDEDIEVEDDEGTDIPDEELPPVDDEVTDDPEDDDEEEVTEVPVHGILAPEGVVSGDYRLFDVGSMSTRDLPVPLRYEIESTHGGTTSTVVTIGRVDEVWRDEDNMMRFRGVIVVTKEYSMKVIEGIVDGTIRGVSIDGDLWVQRELTDEEVNSGLREAYSAIRHAGLTVVPIPAFQEAFIALGSEFADEMDRDAMAAALLASCDCVETLEEARAEIDAMLAHGEGRPEDTDDDDDDDSLGYDVIDVSEQPLANALAEYHAKFVEEPALVAAPGTKDGPGWITHPIPTSRIRRYWVRGEGAAKIRWGIPGDFNRCRRQLVKYVQNPDWLAGLCANMHKEALGVWPGQEGGGRGHSLSASVAPAMTLIAAAGTVKPAAFFKNPGLTKPTPITITDEGHIFGHLATWGVCHVGFQDSCVQAPHSATNYAGFRTGTVNTDEGPVAVGQITMGTGHAAISARSKDAVAHYDNTGLAAADVVVGDDSVGIWVAGMVRPNLTPEQIDELQAAALSGDWRRIGASLELVAALAVNVPGFPIPRALAASAADTGEYALVAAGVVAHEDSEVATVTLTKEEVVGLMRASVDEYRYQERREAALRELEPFKAKVNQHARVAVEEFFKEAVS